MKKAPERGPCRSLLGFGGNQAHALGRRVGSGSAISMCWSTISGRSLSRQRIQKRASWCRSWWFIHRLHRNPGGAALGLRFTTASACLKRKPTRSPLIESRAPEWGRLPTRFDYPIAGGCARSRLGTRQGKAITSRIDGLSVSSITRRSMPMPKPPVEACPPQGH